MTLICWVHQELFWRFVTCRPALLSDIRYINCKFDFVCTLESDGVLWFIASTKFIPIACFKQIVLLLIPNSVSLFRYVGEAWSRQVNSMSLSIMPWAYMKPVYVQKLASEVYPPDEGTSLTWKCPLRVWTVVWEVWEILEEALEFDGQHGQPSRTVLGRICSRKRERQIIKNGMYLFIFSFSSNSVDPPISLNQPIVGSSFN